MKTIKLPDGYNGATCLFNAEPIETDGQQVKLRCADPGQEFMTAWKRKEDLWTKQPERPGLEKFAIWEHATGWKVHHCGHPTANWPFFLEQPGRNETIVSFNGHGFKTGKIARAVVDKIIAGELHPTNNNCVPGIMRVLVTALGTPVTEVEQVIDSPEGIRVLVTPIDEPPLEQQDEPQDDETHNDRFRDGSGHFVGGN